MARDPKSSYYDAGGIEVMDVIKAKLTPEQFEGYCLGNIIKYSLRANHKGSKVRDIEKIGQYQSELDRHVAPAKVGPSWSSWSPAPAIKITDATTWNWKPLVAQEFNTKAAKDQEAFWASVHPDYKTYGGL